MTIDSSAVNHGIPTRENFLAFRSGALPLAVLPNAMDSSQVDLLRQDAKALQSLGFGASAGIATGESGVRSGVHQIWLASPGSPSQENLLLGNLDARRDLFRFVHNLRSQLELGGFRCLPPELLELSYLLYDENGASYARHLDTFSGVTTTNSDHRRSISLLLYLGDDDEGEKKRPWECDRDGGALRIYGNPANQCTGGKFVLDDPDGWSDITPRPGSLVLLDSATVPHEVMTTKRSRACVAAWFGSYTDS